MSEPEEKALLKKVDEILFYIKSDPTTKRVGMFEMLQNHNKDIENIKTRYKVVYRVGIVLGAIIGGILTWIAKIKSLF